jgi:hypothetical protein
MSRAGLGAAGCIAIIAFTLLASSAARAAACAEPREAATGPLPGGTDAADFGAIPEACAATDLTLRARATALVASSMPDFYGFIGATGTLRLRHRIGRTGRLWLTLAADIVTFRYVVNAVVISDGLAFGPPTLGLHRALGDGEHVAASIYGRVLLPLDTARANSVRTGFELGATVRRPFGASGRWGVEGGLAALEPLVAVGGQAHATLEPVALVQGWFSPRPRTAVFAGLGARGEVAPDPTFLTLAPRVAGRFVSKRGLSFSFQAELGAAGVDRTNAIVAFFLGWAAQTPSTPAPVGP